MTSRDWVGRVKHSTHILRSSHPVGLGNLPDPRVRVERVNPIGLKLDLTITLAIKIVNNKINRLQVLIVIIIYYLRLIYRYKN